MKVNYPFFFFPSLAIDYAHSLIETTQVAKTVTETPPSFLPEELQKGLWIGCSESGKSQEEKRWRNYSYNCE